MKRLIRVPKIFLKLRKLLLLEKHQQFLVLRNRLLWPIHALIAMVLGALIRLWSLLTGQHIRIANLTTYSFGALVLLGPFETQDEASKWAETGGKTWIFLHGPFVNDGPFVLSRIVESSHGSVTFIQSRVLRYFYSWYCPAHLEEPLFKTWRTGKLPVWASPITVDSGLEILQDHYGSVKEQMRNTFELKANTGILRNILIDHGYSPGKHAGIVCFNVRDSQFRLDQAKKSYSNISSVHPRDSDIRHFTKAIESAIAQGYFCVRVGKTVASALDFEDENFWDYAASSFHDEKLDIWLAQECVVAISTCSGWDALPPAFGRPLVFVDVGEEFFWATAMVEPTLLVPKRIIETATGRIVRASDLGRSAKSGREIWLDLQKAAPAKFQIVGLTDLEIQESVELSLEMLRSRSPSPWQLHQAMEVSKFWTDHLVPLGYPVPKSIPLIPKDFFERNRSWLIH